MIGKCGAQLDRDQLEEFCEVRKRQALESQRNVRREEINMALAEIEKANFPVATTRPFGVTSEDPVNQDWFWKLVLDHITEPSEIINLSQVSQMFRRVLRQKYLETRLPEIVKIILDKRCQYLDSEARVGPNLRDMILISRQCKRSMEEIVTGFRYVEIRSIATLDKIAEGLKINPCHASTFCVRQLVLSVKREAAFRKEVKEGMKVILKSVGAQVHRFTYYSYLRSSQKIYANLRKWVRMMPNLQSLYLSPRATEEEAPVLIQAFPTIASLQSFEEDSTVLPVQYVQKILEANPGIKELDLGEEDNLRAHSLELLRSLENLIFLRICPPQRLLQERDLPWKLNKIVLEREDVVDEGRYFKTTTSSCRLFSFLKQFQDTLEHAEIMIDILGCNDSCGYLELPNLKTFKWRFHNSFDNVNFLLHCGKLKKMDIVIGWSFTRNMTPSQEYNRIVESSFLGKRIWNVFPSLETVRLLEPDIIGTCLLEEHRVTP